MITLRDVIKTFQTKEGLFHGVKSVSLQVEEHDIYGIAGLSGAGKSTLLRTMNLLEKPDSGAVIVNGEDLTQLSKKDLRTARQSIGMIFQHFHLLHNKTVSDNIALPLELKSVPKEERAKRVRECLEIVGLSDKAQQFPSQLSGGQKQRVAIARALANDPKVLLCDEPTSALDPKTTISILQFLQKINKELGVTIVIVTHEMNVIKQICNKVAVMEDGEVVESFNLNDHQIKPKSEIAKLLLGVEQERGIAYVQ
ncbi:ATP-binding cassette domain-containing protein [Bacillus sp. DX1.1]|uniref:methionine ABC transporter ATP-binding protein n=1 Tax=unclassified Bacillus (in: firmicutes) TaxID=185979 RepID=UPI0025705148|nr:MULTISPECIES: ATP-binding cassette domain-containing protein [unclassified Bacillus (in: firmicutes)]MDM5155380.1 ATP-binding cassette domain-containing protein [Bacillus sp. DX1.1]WJE79695.1 ATP-binding cassette domain-containing protein [Bacillus sp. DX3.1]